MTTKNDIVSVQMDKLLSITDQFREQLLNELAQCITAIFPNLPENVNISLEWTQYTPYFNDGEECSFSVNSCDINLTYHGEYLTTLNSYRPSPVSPEIVPPQLLGQLRETSKNLERNWPPVSDALMLFLFDDHVQVTFQNGEFTVEEHDHE